MINRYPCGSDFVLLWDAMTQLLQESWVPSGGSRWHGLANGARATWPPLPPDVYAMPGAATIVAAVPGMNLRDFEITYHQYTVTLAGSMPSAVESEQGKSATCFARELWSVPFRRTVTLPFAIDATQAQASFANGIVRITLPKAEWAKPWRIAVTAGGQREAIGAGATS
jgi:HSP20 family protein